MNFTKKYNKNKVNKNDLFNDNILLEDIDNDIIKKNQENKEKNENLNIYNDYSFDQEDDVFLNEKELFSSEEEQAETEKKFNLNFRKKSKLDFKSINQHTLELINFIMNLFSKIDLVNEYLLRNILKKYALKVSENLKNSNIEYYNKGINYLKSLQINKERTPENYFEFTYEDFLLILCSIINYYTNLDIKIKFEGTTNIIDLFIYGNEEKYSFLAEKLQYELQLKPYAYKYELYKHIKDKRKKNDKNTSFIRLGTNEILLTSNEEGEMYPFDKPLQFEKLNDDSPFYFPPYMKYNSEHEIKYRRYNKNDLYHECPIHYNKYDEICDNCSKFRNIYKLLLINYSIEKLINFEYFKRQEVLVNRIHKRNYLSYGVSIEVNKLQEKTLNFFNKENTKYLINLIRNYHGEKVAYYFLYLNHYMKWLIIPSIIGLIFMFLKGNNPITKLFPIIKYEHVYRILFCVIITIWSTLFIKSWGKKEKFYSYLWGTENYKQNETKHETFVPELEKYFILGEKIQYSKPSNRIIKRIFSYFVLLLMGFITIVNSCYILYKKQVFLNDLEKRFENKDINIYFAKFSSFEIFLTAVFAALNAIVIKSMGFFYKRLAKFLNEWENYEKEYQARKDKIIKLIIFEFINNYTGGFFIAFVKPNLKNEKYSKCSGGSCVTELSTLVYTLIFIEFLTVFFDVGVPIVLNFIKKYKIKKINPNINLDFPTHSLDNQKIITESDPMLYEYNKILVLFGYICLFSASAPITPIGILFVVYLYSFTDLAKKFKFERVNIIDKSNGIEIYNTLMKGLMFVGLVVNSGIIMFSEKFNTGEEWFWKVLGLLILENFIISVYFLIDFNILPNWFSYLDDIKQLYDVKYYSRKENELPHWRYMKIRKNSEYDI